MTACRAASPPLGLYFGFPCLSAIKLCSPIRAERRVSRLRHARNAEPDAATPSLVAPAAFADGERRGEQDTGGSSVLPACALYVTISPV
ncbi:hypothetical protein SRHO_G00153490 [Serrasalmus rhombeus]